MSGTSTLWVSEQLGIDIVFTIEMPPSWANGTRGLAGFVLPADRIEPVCEETWTGIEAVLDHLTEVSAASQLNLECLSILINFALFIVALN